MTRKHLEEFVQRYADGSLNEEEFIRLQEELQSDTKSREFFRKSMEVELLLAETMGQRMESWTSRDKMDRLLLRRRKRDVTRASLATAAILVLSAVVMTFIMIKPAEPPTLACELVPGTQWEVTGNAADGGDAKLKVTEGSTVRVLSGTVRMELESGAVMVMRGPAEARFPKLNEPVLKHGWLWIDSGEKSDSFTVETPGLIVRNFGTRFGIRVQEEGLAEIHLIKGKLKVTKRKSEDEPIVFEPEKLGFLVPAQGEMTELPLAADPFPDLPELLVAAADYRTTILSQGPVGYWKFDSQSGRSLENELGDGAIGYRANGAFPDESGVGNQGVFKGFPDTNRSIRLSGDPMTSVITKIDIPGGVSREEGGVAFWIRRLPDSDREEVLWLAGKTPTDASVFPREAIMHLRLSPSGRVEFFIENGKFDVLLCSNYSVTDDRWHHIAASWGPAAVELFVDGRRVERAEDFGSLKEGTMHGEYVRFGKPSNDLAAEGKQSFTGWVDEIAIWNRPLGSAEVAQQFRVAREALMTDPSPKAPPKRSSQKVETD